MNSNLLRDLRAEVARDPNFLADALPVLAEGTRDFVTRTRETTDARMGFALLAAISMMSKLNLQSVNHRNTARVIVEYGKLTKAMASEVERRLCTFVEEADALFPEEAAAHYATLRRS